MTRALTLCSLLLLPLSACDDAAYDLVESADRPSAIPDPPAAPLPEVCELYCSEHRDTCGSVDFGYASVPDCEALCGYWTKEDTICRLDVLEEFVDGAAESVDVACADAGPDSEPCGSAYVVTCDRYCDEFRAVCHEEGSFDASFESPQKCRTWCGGEPMFGAEDTIECRLGALEPSVAGPADCEAASPDTTCD